VPAGPGRVDALTQIVNALAVFNLGTPENPIASSPIARNAARRSVCSEKPTSGVTQRAHRCNRASCTTACSREQRLDVIEYLKDPERFMSQAR
jgi:hypothetical protein